MFYGAECSTIPVTESSPLGPFQNMWRRFNLDRSPKLLYARGAMVDLLVQSKVSRYLEFRGVGRTLSYIDGKMVEVPCSAADVFNTTLLKLTEKNVIKRFLTFCLNHDQHTADYQDFASRPFKEYLSVWPVGKKPQLSPFLQRLVLHCIAMCSEQVSTEDGLKATQYYLRSIGRYGNTPFLWPMYGSGELPQAFCRMSAVFGGIFVLNRSLKSVVVTKSEEERCSGAVCNLGQKLKCKWIVMNKEYSPSSWQVRSEARASSHGTDSHTDSNSVSRLVLITDRSLSPSSSDGVGDPFLLTIPPSEEMKTQHVAHLLELPSSTGACPSGCYIVQMTSLGSTAEEDFSAIVKTFFNSKRPVSTTPPPSSPPVSTEASSSASEGTEDTAARSDATPAEAAAEGTAAPCTAATPEDDTAISSDKPELDNDCADPGNTDVSGTPAASESSAEQEDTRPVIYERFYFNQSNPVCTPVTASGVHIKNIFVTTPTNAELGYSSLVKEAREVFDTICPGEEFLPPAPEPEDICFDRPGDDGDKAKESTDAGSSEQRADDNDHQESTEAGQCDEQETECKQPSGSSSAEKSSSAGGAEASTEGNSSCSDMPVSTDATGTSD
eukprot:scpid45171/ scgid13259/ Rab proteins geranylgeranyltransferase component A 1; Choroideraemia protein homolog; Rab escort protein 1